MVLRRRWRHNRGERYCRPVRSRPLLFAAALLAIPAAIAAWATVRSAAAPSEANSATSSAPAAVPSLPSASVVAAAPPASAGAAPGGAPSPDPGESPPAPSGAPAGSTGGEGELARATSTAPEGVHVALDAKLVVHFDRAVPQQAVTVTIDPPAEGKRSWPDPQTFVLEPVAWHEGKRHNVTLGGPGIEPLTFQFTSLAPPPERVEPGGGSKVTLTFDDGSTRPAEVRALLDLLEKEGVSAIFFPTGQWAETHPRLVERMVKDGHRVCNHTYSHRNLRLPQLTDDVIRDEIARGAGAGTCKLFRPPLRAHDPRVERIVAEMGYTMYLWDVDSRDWEGLPAEDMVNRVLKRVRPGSVVLFHMHAAETLTALPVVIQRLRKAGYVFRDPEDAGAP